MTFLNPAILAGLLAIGLPVLIHLLSKPRLKRIRWAAVKFLLDSIQKNRRRVLIEDMLLLILRCLLVAVLVLMFARPALLTEGGVHLGGLASPAVILLDNSESMGQSDGTKTRFEQAKSMADDLLSKLEPGSSSALYLVSDHVKAVIPQPTHDLAILRRSIDQATLTDGGSNLFPGIKRAVDLLKTLPGDHREIFVLTDSQSAAWRDLGKIRDLQQQDKDVAMHFVIVGDKGEDNLAVSKLELAGTVAAVNQPLRCAVTVSNWSKTAALSVPVKLAADGEPPQDEGMIDRIEPGASRNLMLIARFREPGYHSLTASIPGDRLPADNQRSTALLVLDQINALVVEGTSNPDPTARDGFFLSHALVPVSADKVAQYYVKVSTGLPNDLENSSITQYQVIFLSNVGQLSPRAAQNLHDYVSRGGALVIFPGAATDIGFYNDSPNFSPLLPAKLAPVAGPPDQHFLAWQSHGYDHPLVDLWNKPDSGNLSGVQVTKYYPLTLKPAPTDASSDGPTVVVKYVDGEPAVTEQTVGKGKVILFSSSATTSSSATEWTTLPIHPSFVPLLIRIISYVTSGLGGNPNVAVGQPFATPVDSEYAGKELSVLRPGEKKHRAVGEVEAGDQSAVIRYSDTDEAGPYQLFISDDVKPKVVFAAQSDPEESNLAQISKTDIDPLLNPAPPTKEGGNTPAPPPASLPKVPGKELWIPLAVTALILALVEMMLAHWFSQSK